jgi:hypothetical protein
MRRLDHHGSSIAQPEFRSFPCGDTIGKRLPRYGLFFCSDFSGYELQRDEDQAASSSGRANHYAAVPVPGVNPCL